MRISEKMLLSFLKILPSQKFLRPYLQFILLFCCYCSKIHTKGYLQLRNMFSDGLLNAFWLTLFSTCNVFVRMHLYIFAYTLNLDIIL
jgi:hypothetical protein